MHYNLILNTLRLEELISERKVLLNRLLSEKKRALSKAPNGHLHIKKHGKYNQYYLRTDSSDPTGSYIRKKNKSLAARIAQRDFDSQVLEQCRKEILLMDKWKNNEFPTDFDKMYAHIEEKRRELVTPLSMSDEEYIREWESVEYKGLPFNENDNTEYYTEKKERVRSKSEILIANTLKSFNVPYRYEYPVYVEGGRYVSS